MLEEFKRYLKENKLVKKNDRVLLAVSGGIDSMAMTNLFLSAGTDIAIAHCNFSLRGSESDGDEEFIKKFASDFKIPFFSEKFDTTGFAEEKGISIQMAARELRYRWFEEIRVKNNFVSVSVAHNLNDNVETFLINLTRGTGIAGLTGMKPRHKNIIRPMLFASRNAIREYCSQNNICYREDRSNADIKYTRNKIRHKILPLFGEINPSFDVTITETAERLNQINEILTSHISEIKNKISSANGNLTTFSIKGLADLSPRPTLLYELFRPYGIGNGQIEDLSSLISGKTGSMLVTDSCRIIKNRNEILVMKIEEESESYIEIKGISEFVKYNECVSAEIKKITSDFSIPGSSNIATLDADKVSFPLIVRKWRHGDTFYPFGMKQKKKLSDYFIDNKYSVFAKERCRILESQGKIVWIINDRIDNRFRIMPATKRAMVIEVKKS
jgi:tRNA(Ile)-lysidine synthase